jgi:hypothetical protein
VRFTDRGESIGMMQKPEGSSGESSLNDASMGAKISSEHVPALLSSTPLYICHCNQAKSTSFTEEKRNDSSTGDKFHESRSHLQEEQITVHQCILVVYGVS